MGKRSNFERRPGDFYPTPSSAVLPLIPHLRGVRTFAEPCCGDGALVRHLESFGLRCVYAGDIRSGQDVVALDQYGVPLGGGSSATTTGGRGAAREAAPCPPDPPQEENDRGRDVDRPEPFRPVVGWVERGVIGPSSWIGPR